MVQLDDLAKLKKLVCVFKKVPHLTIHDAMQLAKYSNKEGRERSSMGTRKSVEMVFDNQLQAEGDAAERV